MHDISNTQTTNRNTKRTSSLVVPDSLKNSSLSEFFKSSWNVIDDTDRFGLDERIGSQNWFITDKAGFIGVFWVCNDGRAWAKIRAAAFFWATVQLAIVFLKILMDLSRMATDFDESRRRPWGRFVLNGVEAHV